MPSGGIFRSSLRDQWINAFFHDWLHSSSVWYEQAAGLALSTLKATFSLTEFEAELEQLDSGAETLASGAIRSSGS